MAVEDDKRDDHENRMPIELDGGVFLPGETVAKVEDPDEHQDDDQRAETGCDAVKQRHPLHLRLVGQSIHFSARRRRRLLLLSGRPSDFGPRCIHKHQKLTQVSDLQLPKWM